MDVPLPSADQVHALLPRWRADHPALDALQRRYGAPAPALRHLGLALWQANDVPAATRLLAAAAVLAGDLAPYWSSLGGVVFAGGHAAAAAAILRQALALDPRAVSDWLLLGTILKAGGDPAAAEEAFLRAVALDPTSPEAALGLGLLHMEGRRFETAATHLRIAAAGDAAASVHACLGQVLSNLGDFSGSAAAFEAAVACAPDDAALRHKWGQARFVAALVDGSLEAAWQAYAQAAGRPPDDGEKMMRDAFHLLSGYGHVAAAIRLGEARRADGADDPVLAYLLEALRGTPAARAPEAYIVAYFDKFAEAFDTQLTQVLRYRGPEDLDALVARRRASHACALDLGCGTGLAGPLLRPRTGHLAGVDLSPRMLDKARARGCYDALALGEAVDHLARHPQRFDLIFAADVLVYIGDLVPLLEQAARALRPDGLLALTIETTRAQPFRLLPSGRFAHAPDVVTALAREAGFAAREHEETVIRLEANQPVAGALLLFARP